MEYNRNLSDFIVKENFVVCNVLQNAKGIILTVLPCNESVPIKTLIISYPCEVSNGDHISARILRYDEITKRVEDPNNRYYDYHTESLGFIDRPFSEREFPIEIEINGIKYNKNPTYSDLQTDNL